MLATDSLSEGLVRSVVLRLSIFVGFLEQIA